MKMGTKGRFAVTAMLDLTMHGHDGPVTLAAISERQKISLSYLEQLFGKLRRRELVDSIRGPGGGYQLAREAAKVTVADIICAVEEPLDSTQCGGRENCLENQRCMTHDLWEELNTTVHGFLSRISLAQLAEKQRTRPVSVVRNPGKSREPHPVSA
jgi:Rrf2 family iron-sulfur cluster assembly transcriptional regulator